MRGGCEGGDARGAASGLRKGLRPLTRSRDWVGDFCILLPRVYAGVSPLRRRPKGKKTDERLRSPFGNLRSAHPCFLIFIVAGGTAPAGATRGLCGRLLDPFGADTPMQLFACLLENTFGFPCFLTSIGTFSVHAAAFPPKPPKSPSNFPFPGIFLPLRSFHTQGAHFQPSSTSEKRSITPCSTFGKSC